MLLWEADSLSAWTLPFLSTHAHKSFYQLCAARHSLLCIFALNIVCQGKVQSWAQKFIHKSIDAENTEVGSIRITCFCVSAWVSVCMSSIRITPANKSFERLLNFRTSSLCIDERFQFKGRVASLLNPGREFALCFICRVHYENLHVIKEEPERMLDNSRLLFGHILRKKNKKWNSISTHRKKHSILPEFQKCITLKIHMLLILWENQSTNFLKKFCLWKLKIVIRQWPSYWFLWLVPCVTIKT